MTEIKYTGDTINADRSQIKSDCQLIAFFNFGDTPVTITSRDSGMGISWPLAGRTAAKIDYTQFGIMNPDMILKQEFEVTFGTAVTTKQVAILRVKLIKTD